MTDKSEDLEVVRFEQIIREHKGHLESILEGMVEGVREGVKEGVSEGFKAGILDGLNESLAKGFINVGEEDIKDIAKDISEEIIRESVKESAEKSIEKGVKKRLQGVCEKIIAEIRSKDTELSELQVKTIITLIKKTEKEAVERIWTTLPNNFFSRASMGGLLAALEDCFAKSVAECETRIYNEIRKQDK